MQENHYLVPLHKEGSKKDLQHHIVAYTTEDAEYWFVDVKDRLLDVNNWNKYCPVMTAEFRLTDHHGLGVGRHARKGDLIRTKVPVADQQDEGFYWVVIEVIEYDDYPDLSMETFGMRVRVTPDPHENKDGQKAKQDATFTFVIERRGPKLFGSFHGRDEAGSDSSPWLALPDLEWVSLIKKLLG